MAMSDKLSAEILDGIYKAAEKLRDEQFLKLFYGTKVFAPNNAVLGPKAYHGLTQAGDKVLMPNEHPSLFGIPVRQSPMFDDRPVHCSKCEGTGEGGEESTYCNLCKGGGAVKHLGMMYNDPVVNFFGNNMTDPRMVLLVEYLPRKFDPSFPDDVPVPLRKIPDRPTYVLQPAF